MTENSTSETTSANQELPEEFLAELAGKITAVTGLPAARLGRDAVIADLGMDSMTTVELVVDLQEDYEILLSRDDFTDVRTVGDLAGLIYSRLP